MLIVPEHQVLQQTPHTTATLADYKILHDTPRRLYAESNPDTGSHFLNLPWSPPPNVVPSTGDARPVLTLQLWTVTATRFSLWFEKHPGYPMSGMVTRSGLPAGQLITHSTLVGGDALANEGRFKIYAEHYLGEPSEFHLEYARIDFQRYR